MNARQAALLQATARFVHAQFTGADDTERLGRELQQALNDFSDDKSDRHGYLTGDPPNPIGRVVPRAVQYFVNFFLKLEEINSDHQVLRIYRRDLREILEAGGWLAPKKVQAVAPSLLDVWICSDCAAVQSKLASKCCVCGALQK